MLLTTFSKLVLFAASVGLALGHGKLTSPVGFQIKDYVSTVDCRRYTTRQPCGMGVKIPYPQNPPIYMVGEGLNVVWRVANVDGAGPMQAYVDPTGTGQYFTQNPVRIQTGVPGIIGLGARGFYRMSLITPNVQCSGPGGSCLIRVQNATGFASCIWVRIRPRMAAQKNKREENSDAPGAADSKAKLANSQVAAKR
ncbi:uncharacterized protein VTP21DRAFT_2331 [Calcarisporiella thermophila]|uniref:uncharacterized protein n=1 Tax=Calcarisporiella thermophila TaxID=911321 RepID=UPI003742F05F